MALYELFRKYARVAFEVIDVLCKIGQEFALVLEEADECVGR